jgi:hypothetical protein
MKIFNKLLGVIFCLCLLGHQVSFASDYSYIFIQGDKQTPFYVKLEGQMMPRLGKNYCILPNLDKGTIHIEILFQQNIYPSQKFTIKVPAAAGRGFTLQQVSEDKFALYDLTTRHTLKAGNKEEDDVVDMDAPVDEQSLAWGNTTEADLRSSPKASPASELDIPVFDSNKKAKSKKEKRVKEERTEPVASTESSRFIDDIELNKGADLPPFRGNSAGRNTENATGNKKEKASPVVRAEDRELYEGSTVFNEPEAKTTPVLISDEGLPNSDCPTAMNNDDFEDFAIKIMDKSDDDAQLKYLRKVSGKQCFTTEQVRILAKNLETQSGRFEAVKMLYPRVADQSNYGVLESLFNTAYLKGKFKELIGAE